jgi:subtilisin family serine protease
LPAGGSNVASCPNVLAEEATMTRRHIALAALTAGLLPLAGLSAPALAGPATTMGHDHASIAHVGGLTRVHSRLVGVRHGVHIDASLANATGPVTVMLRLAGRPAAAAYNRPGTPALTGLSRQLQVTAFRSQQRIVSARQRSLVRNLSAPATRATTLYRLSAGYNGVAVRTDASRLAALSRLPGVRGIVRLVPMHVANSVTVPLIGAPEAWQGASGDTGAGVTIAVLDTGLDYTHADFGGAGTVAAYKAALASDTAAPAAGSFDPAKYVGGFDLAGDAYDADAGSPFDTAGDPNPADAIPHPDPNPLDCNDHGTHVAGSAAGYGVLANGNTAKGTDYSSLASLTPDQYQARFHVGPGVAPSARLFAVKILGCAEEATTNLIAKGIDRLIKQNLTKSGPHIDVLNMSLGGDYSSAQDPIGVETNVASKDAGIEVVSAVGNGGDVFDIAGTPGSAVRGLAVAASDDSQDIADALRVNSPGTIAGNQPGEESVLFDWGSLTSPVTADLAIAGNISQPPSNTNDADGCDPITTDLTGRIAYLSWTDNDATRRCGSLARVDNARDAGAVGAVFFNDENEFTAGINGDADIPAMLITKSAGDIINSELLAGHPVSVSLDPALHNDTLNNHPETTNAIVGFSSRGVGAVGNLKPDVAAPGQTVFYAGMGTGDDGLTESGTSMAAPHAAGVAALVRAVHPGWSAEQIKAAIMNTATQSVFARDADGAADHQSPEAPMRVGAGRVEADSAVATSTLAYNADGRGGVSVSFGRVDAVHALTTRSAKVRVVNTSSATVAYTAGYHPIDVMPGASYAVSPTSFSVPSNSSVLVTVTLNVHRNRLIDRPDRTLQLDPLELGAERSFVGDASGQLTVTPTGGSALHVPVYAAPRPASTMRAPDQVTIHHHHGSFLLAGRGVDNSGLDQRLGDALDVSKLDAFELQGTSGRIPICSAKRKTHCITFPDQRAADLAAVGFASDVPGILAHHIARSVAGAVNNHDAFGYFGIATHGPWVTEAGVQEFDVYLDVDGSGGPDAVLYNTRIQTTEDTDYLMSELDDKQGDVLDEEFLNNSDGSLNTNVFDSDVLTLPFALGALEAVGWNPAKHPRIKYYVDSQEAEFAPFDSPDPSAVFDSIGDPFAGQRLMSVDLTKPAYTVSGTSKPCTQIGACGVLLTDKKGKKLSVREAGGQVAGDRVKGLLIFHHDNVTGARAQIIAVKHH